jgi:hypothetical protein
LDLGLYLSLATFVNNEVAGREEEDAMILSGQEVTQILKLKVASAGFCASFG